MKQKLSKKTIEMYQYLMKATKKTKKIIFKNKTCVCD